MFYTDEQLIVLYLMAISVICFVFPFLYVVIKTKFMADKKRKSELGLMVIISLFLVLSIWTLKCAIGYFSVVTAAPGELVLGEEVIKGFYETLRTFGLDEELKVYIENLKNMTAWLTPASSSFLTINQGILIAYAFMLTILAPVAGGAIIFEVIASIFPKIRLFFLYRAYWRKKFYFSEINEISVALASEIFKKYSTRLSRPVLIFTDAYIDNDDEKKAELLSEIKALGAICVKDDIAHVKKAKTGERVFLLLDENESSNLQALTDLSEEYNSEYVKKSEIFYLTSSDAYIEIERRIYDKLEKEFGFDKEKDMPTFIPINSYRNLVTNLLVKVPLFEPLIDKPDKNKLTVTILGAGQIGIEMFLAAYWMGQILDCQLNINIVSEETENEFWSKIDYINPEIRSTTQRGNPILAYNNRGEKAAPYCKVNYFCYNAKSSDFIEMLNEQEATAITDTDYYFVSLGSDELNISMANTIKNAVGKHHISEKDGRKAVVAYVVYDQTVSDILNRKKLFSFAGETADILMYAVGNLNDVYSAENIFMKDYEARAEKMHISYLKAQGQQVRAEAHKSRIKDDYKYWANLARSMHTKYKMFSAGIYYDSVFNFDSPEDRIYMESVEVALNRYKNIATGKITINDTEEERAHINLMHRLAWLEKRRWNAFTRVKGFRHTADYDVYAKSGETGSYKQMELKLHPCLVECDEMGIRATINIRCELSDFEIFKDEKNINTTKFDLLDELSYDLLKKGYNEYDFKQYDYPNNEFNS